MKKTEQNNIFSHLHFLLIIVISVISITLDVRTKLLSDFRYYVESALYPLLVFADSPHVMGNVIRNQFQDHSELIRENERLATENFMQRAELLKLQDLEAENNVLRKLLNSPARSNAKRLFAEIIDVDPDPYMQRIIVNRGSSSGVYEGMPVLTDQGLVGQVMNVNYSYSRVLLATDPNCSIPVVDGRSLVRGITKGASTRDEIFINNIPRSADIKEGDLIYTSGIGGVYPKGYPVATVTSVGSSDSEPFSVIKAKTLVDLDKMRYVLMSWTDDKEIENETFVAKAKELTNAKAILHQEKINKLIETLSDTNKAKTEGNR